ncbi:MAG: putative quinol monooxygenase [Rhodococcus sp. (in: high G+C Gram-positive bacteria)]
MSDLHVVATIPVTEGFDEVLEAMRGLAEKTREEDGCIEYHVFTSNAAPDTIVTTELWRDQAALDAHMASPHMADIMGRHSAKLGALAIHPLTPA